MEPMMISQTTMPSREVARPAFTLVELVLVIVIIATMVAIAIPYATRSNRGQKLEQKSLNMVEAINYIMDLAVTMQKPTRIVLDPQMGYTLEVSEGEGGKDYVPVEGYLGKTFSFGDGVSVLSTTGFAASGNNECLVFDPQKPWPRASISLMISESIKTIEINCKQAEIYESEI